MTGRYQTYPEYNESGSKWLDEVPSGWKVTALKHVLDTPITDGPHSTPTFLDEGIPFVSAEAVSGGYINFNKIRGHISEEDDVFFSQKYRPKKHDVYMVKSGATTGITAIVETDKRFNIWSPLAVMRCKDTYNPYFLLNYLRSDTFQNSVQLSWTFGTQQNIGMNILENLTVCSPPFEEQQKIANFLDHETAKIDTLITKQEKLIELLKEKRQAVISHAVTRGLNPNAPMKDSGVEWLGEVPESWKVIKFGLTNKKAVLGGNYLSGEGEEGLPLIKMGNLGRGDINLNKVEYLAKTETYDTSFFLEKGDFLFNTRNSLNLVGKVSIWRGELSKALYNSNILRITFDEKFVSSNSYMSYLFNSDLGLSQLRLIAKGTTSVAAIYYKELKSLIFSLPPLNEQAEISDFLDAKTRKIDLLIEKSDKAIVLIKERKTALISAAVTGKIDVRNWQNNG